MCFTFVSAGWEGSMHDTRVFYNVVMDPNKHFPHPEGGKFFVTDLLYVVQFCIFSNNKFFMISKISSFL